MVFILSLLVAACGGDESGGSSTVATEATTTTAFSSTPDPTVTTIAETTSTSSTTTTTLPPTTTTIPGNWADEPLIVSSFGALGWWNGSGWSQVNQGTILPISGGEDYRVAVLGLSASTTGGPQVTVCEPLDNPGVELANSAVLGDFPGPFGVAISAPWALVPHLVEQVEDDGTYAGFASNLLASRGLSVPNPVIKQLLRVDLEGDGVNEVIVVAEYIANSPGLFASVGDYSIAFMRKVVAGEVQTAILGEAVVTEVAPGEIPFILSYGVGAVADLNGDGKLEVVLSETYYEGAAVGVWEYIDDDLGPVNVLSVGCGA